MTEWLLLFFAGFVLGIVIGGVTLLAFMAFQLLRPRK